MRGDSNNAIMRETHSVHAKCHLLQNGLLMFDCSVVLPCIETTRPDDHNGIDGTFKVPIVQVGHSIKKLLAELSENNTDQFSLQSYVQFLHLCGLPLKVKASKNISRKTANILQYSMPALFIHASPFIPSVPLCLCSNFDVLELL